MAPFSIANSKSADIPIDNESRHEYFETNVEGSKNICNFADHTTCKNIIFTSSIAVYGTGDYEKNETTKLTPSSAYGKSKL